MEDFEKGFILSNCKWNSQSNPILFLFADMLMLKQLKKESESLDKWMEEVRSFLTAEDVGWGDVDVLEAQLEQSNVVLFPLSNSH